MYFGKSELDLFEREFQAFTQLKKGHPNLIKAFNAKIINAYDNLHSGVDFSLLIDKSALGPQQL
jgi:hypothetical protein